MMPLWVWILMWILGKRQERAGEVLNYRMRLKALDELYYALPVPQNKTDRVLVSALIGWADREKERLVTLQLLNVNEIGIIHN